MRNSARRHFGGETGRAVLSLLILLAVTHPTSLTQPLAKGKTKFLGCAMSAQWPSFKNYWNQVTPGNEGKWGSVEGSQGNYNWPPLDAIYNYSVSNSFLFRYHNLVWGQQQPGWITTVDSATQRAEVQEWIHLAMERYGCISFVDVVNEPFHAPPPYASALGGSGSTGWDWVIQSFAWARQYACPTTKLTLNEYNILHDNTATNNYISLVDTLHVRGLIDAIGIQGHYFEFRSPAATQPGYIYSVGAIKANLQRLVATGLPVYITEFDINEPVDSIQLENYKTYFPIFWEEPGVKGITLWGYLQGDVWKVDAYLVRSDGSERPALTWLRKYVASPIPPVILAPQGTAGVQRNPDLFWHSSLLALNYRVQVAANRLFTTFIVDTTVTDTLFHIDSLSANTTYYWRVSAANDSGASSYSPIASFMTGDQIVFVAPPQGRPLEFSLSQNYPNPFNPTTAISYRLAAAGIVTLDIYDLLGRKVATLVNALQNPGTHTVQWNASGLSSGVYVCRMRAGTFVESRKMLLTR
jgi:endo-1,4-beta-xylanase